MINFYTSNFTIVAYPPMAGGKFLINCLALSPDAVFQSRIYAEKDLNNHLSSADKMQVLRNLVSNVKQWNDLMMGCNQLSGAGTNQYREYSGDMSIFTFNHVMELLSNSNKLFFIVAHDPVELRCILKIWPNARVIAFSNCLPFITDRGGRDVATEYWEIIKGPHWPIKAPKTYDELMKCPQFVIDEVNRLFPTMYEKLVDCIERHPHDLSKTVFWNNDWYFSAKKTADGIENLYKTFNLSGFNREYILEFYKLWIEKYKLHP